LRIWSSFLNQAPFAPVSL